MTADENSKYESDTEEPPFEKITFNTDQKIKISLEEPPMDLELKPLPDNLEYVFLEEPSFLPVIISSQLFKENKNKLVSVLKKHKQAFVWKTTYILGICPPFSPATFQRCMLAIFHDMIEESVEVFMDDFFVFRSSFDHYLNNLDKKLQRCEDAHLVLNWKNVTLWLKNELCLDAKYLKQECVDAIEVMDIQNSGLQFTWSQKPRGNDGFLKKIDRIMVSGFHMFCVVHKLKNLKKPLCKLLYYKGNLHSNVNMLRDELDRVQTRLDSDPFNEDIRQEEATARAAFNEACLMEEKFLNRSRIDVVTNADGILFENDNVADVFVSHYETFLGQPGTTSGFNDSDLFRVKLADQEALDMTRNVSRQEVKSTLFSMGNDKAPGPDGYTAAFFKESWDIVADDFVAAVCEFFTNESLGVLISPNQSTFVPGRSIADNILLTQELMHNYHLDRGLPRCAFKVDIQKAYDTVDWEFLKQVLIGFGFHTRMITWIMECVSTTSFSISINGSLYDPLSPHLFTLIMEILTLMLQRSVRNAFVFTYHRYCSKLELINLCFADDLFLFARRDVVSVSVIKNALFEFKEASGLVPSLPKSPTYFCNVPNFTKIAILQTLPFEEGRLPMKYLGRAKVSWEVLCLPKEEEGLDVRRLDLFNKALMVLHIWKLLTLKESLWSRAGLSSLSKVKEVFCNGVWTWPRYLLDKYPLPCLINVLNIRPNAPDQLEWHNELGLSKPFSVATVWSTIRPRNAKVDWCKVGWLSSCIPRHALNFWKSSRSVIAKLVMAVMAYFVWQERNVRLFKNSKRSVNQVIEVIFSSVRLKLLSCRLKKSKDADHLSRIEKEETSDDNEDNDNFPGETLMEINIKDDPWFADFANYLVSNIIPKGMTYQQKNKFFSDVKHYFREEPYLFKSLSAMCLNGPKRKLYQQMMPELLLLFCRFGIPEALISDRGTHFCNEIMEKTMKRYGINHRFSTSYHPQTSGQIENTNRALKRFLENIVKDNPAIWSRKHDDALWAFRTAYKTPTGVTKIVLLGLESVPLTSRFVGMRGCIFNKSLFGIFHAVLSDLGHLSRLHRSNVSFHQALDLNFFDEAVLTTGRLVIGSPCGGSDMVIKDLDLEPKVDAMMRDFLEHVLSLFAPSRSSESTSFKKSLRCWFGSSNRSPWNEHPFCTTGWYRIKEYLSFGSIAENRNMVQTQNSKNNNPPDLIATQLAGIAAKLEVFETMKEDIAALKEGERPRSRSSRNGEGESSWRGRQPQRPYNKIDFSIFSSGDPRGWLMKAEKYFKYYQIPDEEKSFFWEELVQAFTRSFGLAEFQNPDEFLCSIKQTGSVHEYRQEFAKRSSRVSNWPDHCLLGVFLNGLKDELKSYVRIHKPHTVYSAMSLALEFESKLTTHRPGKNASWTPNSKSFQPDPKPTTFTPIPTSTQPKYTPRILDTEKQNRFLKGECFRCGDKYEPGHLCKTGTLKVLEANKDVEEPLTTDLTNHESDPEETVEISLHAILGKPHPTTMKVHGMLHSTEVLILIDGGSTHNFISDVLVNELKLTSKPMAPFGVQIGNEDIIQCSNICKNLPVQVNELKITQDFHPFSLGGADLVLGIQWLATLNTVQANWEEMFMVFKIDRKQYKLQGVVSGLQKSSSFQHLAIDPEIPPCIPAPLQPIVTPYMAVFEEPQDLPPTRSQDHSITLLPNSTPPNIRPYRYSHSQKPEIEK
uniref:Retrotransposon Gag domain, retroviral aspartyl protease n=1 Tax=Tanacetum cinerariifolium TaxID=118510 RepID=A0A6L2KPD5_TANCI|nr:retrotransposon Gag domain, retroviral aspartyl protease [Tanacetum cinerariifolium]